MAKEALVLQFLIALHSITFNASLVYRDNFCNSFKIPVHFFVSFSICLLILNFELPQVLTLGER